MKVEQRTVDPALLEPHLDAAAVQAVARALRQGARSWTATLESGVAAVALLESLEWDTRVLRMRSARLHLHGSGGYVMRRAVFTGLIAAVVEHARADDIRHISIRVTASDTAAIHALEESGFLNVDALVTFAADPSVVAGARGGAFTTRAATSSDAAALSEIAARAFTDGRFHADPSIPPDRAREVYRLWTLACCERAAADAVIVACDGAGTAGFVACRIDHEPGAGPAPAGTIPLIATSEFHRGKGAGSALLAAAGRWFHEHGATTIHVGTQLRNVAAARLYERAGFRFAAGHLSFRKMIEP